MAPYTLPPRDVCPSAAAEVEAYAREKDLDGLFRALMSRVFRERPSDPVDFVFAALAERYPDRAAARGWTTLAPNHPPPDHPDAGARVTVTHPDPEASAYLNRHLAVACLFETLADRLVEDRPARPLAHVVHLLALADRDDHHHPTTTPSRDDALATTTPTRDDDSVPTPEREKDEQSRPDPDPSPLALPRAPRAGVNLARRPSVSAECVTMRPAASIHLPATSRLRSRFGSSRSGSASAYALDASTPSPPPRKTPAERSSIASSVRDSLPFRDLRDDLLLELADAARAVSFPPGEVIIRQGDEGDVFYVVREGRAEVTVRSRVAGEPPRLVQRLGPGDAFGELSLMYDSPRAATVVAVTAVHLWSLRRETFRRVVGEDAARDERRRRSVVDRAPSLAALTPEERARMADAVETRAFARGETVVRAGDERDAVYIVEEGEAEAVDDEGGARRKIAPGDAFGRLTLEDEHEQGQGQGAPPRAWSVVVTSERFVCASLTREAVARLAGGTERNPANDRADAAA